VGVSRIKLGKDEKSVQIFAAHLEGRIVDEKYY